ncbi:MAG: aminoglycoside phosphotransferase family protein [Bacteroidota bacterium]
MKNIIPYILQEEFDDQLQSFHRIEGLGLVNEVYRVQGENGRYVFRFNEPYKLIEYKKEVSCLSQVAKLGVPSPRAVYLGQIGEILCMVQEALPGENGSRIPKDQQTEIWRKLGAYAARFHQIPRIEDAQVEAAEFHADWKARLQYNLAELHDEDSLLQFLAPEEHRAIKAALTSLLEKDFQSGLVHGDLCPRNVLVDGAAVYLLDWGTAEINVVPHIELGILQRSGEATETDFQLFLDAYGMSREAFAAIEPDIRLLYLLHRLDKYRWAEGQEDEDWADFAEKVRESMLC